MTEKKYNIVDVLVATGLVKSRAEAKRKIREGAVTIWEVGKKKGKDK